MTILENKVIKMLILILIDVSLIFASTWIGLILRFDQLILMNSNQIVFTLTSAILLILFLLLFNVYNSVTRYFGINNLIQCVKVIVIYAFLITTIIFFIAPNHIPRSLGLIQAFIFFLLLSVSRLSISLIIKKILIKNILHPIIIYGAGKYAVQVLDLTSKSNEYKVVGLIDIKKTSIGRYINGIKVHSPDEIKDLIKKYKVKNIIFAIRSISESKKRIILSKLKELELKVMVMPSLANLLRSNNYKSEFNNIEIMDILDRNINLNEETISKKIKGKVILISGAGGSIGSELSQQVTLYKPKKLILIDNSEFNLYSVRQKIYEIVSKNKIKLDIICSLTSINDQIRIFNLFKKYKPHSVFHAAAFKHVPLVEENIIDGARNNIFGTINLINASIESKIENFLLISTDKAVRPTNIMGATKRFSELIVQANAEMYKNNDIVFSIVRFGNVLNSSGSVVPLFNEQIERGGPITVTHREITRYFMTIPEAVGLVLQSAAIAKGGEVFVLNMGEPQKIYNLARKMIDLAGYKEKNKKNPYGDIEVIFTGLRPGEKMHEELFIGTEYDTTINKDITIAKEEYISYQKMQSVISELRVGIDEENIQKVLSIFDSTIEDFNRHR